MFTGEISASVWDQFASLFRFASRTGRAHGMTARVPPSMLALSVAVVCLILASPNAFAQDLARSLAAAKTLRCTFHTMATGRWTNGAVQTQVKQTDLKLVFTSINTDEGTAGLVGQFGRSSIIARFSTNELHLIESFRDGPLYVTTVFAKESTPGKLQAVHARHEYADVVLPGLTSSPEQYYGECEVGR
jgi:hypothetical protein